MTEITLEIGSETRCAGDTMPGEVKSVVVDRGTRTATHLVVEPRHRSGLARLVPLDHVDATGGTIRLRYTEAEFKDLTAAEENVAEILLGPGAVEVIPEGWRGADDEPRWDGGQSPPVRGGDMVSETVDLVPRLLQSPGDGLEEEDLLRGQAIYPELHAGEAGGSCDKNPSRLYLVHRRCRRKSSTTCQNPRLRSTV